MLFQHLRTTAIEEIKNRQENKFTLRSLQQQKPISRYPEPNSSCYFRRQDLVPVNTGIVSNCRTELQQMLPGNSNLVSFCIYEFLLFAKEEELYHPNSLCHLKVQQCLYINFWLSFFLSIKHKRKIKFFKLGQIGFIFYPNISQNKSPSGNNFGM